MRKVPLNTIPALIMEYCKDNDRSLSEIASQLNINKNTLRANYLYPMVANKLLRKTSKSKNTNKYRLRTNKPDGA